MAFPGPFGRDRLTDQLQLHRDPDAAGVDQADDAAVGEVHAAADVVEAELGVRARYPDVAGQRQLDAAAHDHAVQCGDDRLARAVQSPGNPAGEPLVQHLPAQVGSAVQPSVDVGGQVGAGAEGLLSVPGQDGQADVGVVAEPDPGVEEQLVGLGVDGVELFRAVQRDVGDLAAFGVEHFWHR